MQRSEPQLAAGSPGADGRAHSIARPSELELDHADAERTTATIGDLTIDRERYAVTLEGRALELTYTEFQALWALARRDGRVVSPDQLARELWGTVPPRARRRIAVTISRLRSRLGPDGADYIRTVHRVGYRLTTPA
jgi:DNA-binding response OmpR family regulator